MGGTKHINITDPNYISKTFDNNLNNYLLEKHKINLPNPFNDETLHNSISEVSKINRLEPICPIGSDICNNENIINIDTNGLKKHSHIDFGSFDYEHNHTLDSRIVPDSFNFNSGHNHSFDNVVQHELPSLNTMIDQNLNNFLDNHNSGFTIASF